MSGIVELLTEANRCHRAGEWGAAARLYQQAIESQSANADLWYLLGTSQQGLGQTAAATASLRQAVRLQPDRAQLLHTLGLLLVAQQQWDEGLRYLRQSLEQNFESAEVREQLGVSLAAQLAQRGRELLEQRQTDDAIATFREALDHDSRQLTALAGLGDALRWQKQWDEAVACYLRILDIQPDSAAACLHVGGTLKAKGDDSAAESYLRRAIELDPRRVDAHVELGRVLINSKRYAEAEPLERHALELNPLSPEAHHYLGAALAHQDRLDEAIVCYRRALEIKPDFVRSYGNLGNALCEQGHLEQGAECFRHAIELNPNSPAAHLNLGLTLARQTHVDAAIESFTRALELQDDYVEARTSRAMMLLLAGRFEEGWREYEWRFQLPDGQEEPMPRPRWHGGNPAGLTLFLCGEQGFGDTLQFVRYAELLHTMGARIIVGCLPPLISLLKNAPFIEQVVTAGDSLPYFDYYVPLLSLPGIMGTTLETIPAYAGYLAPDADSVVAWSRELGEDRSFKVGLAWQGNPQHHNDRRRSFSLAACEPLAAVEGVRFYSLQFGKGSQQLATVSGRWPIVDLGDRLGDFNSMAAIMYNLDLIISCDSAPAHLAGALGLPVWVPLAFAPDWRWMLERRDSPWYPTMRLFRQSQPGDWQGVVENVQHALRLLVAKCNGTADDGRRNLTVDE